MNALVIMVEKVIAKATASVRIVTLGMSFAFFYFKMMDHFFLPIIEIVVQYVPIRKMGMYQESMSWNLY